MRKLLTFLIENRTLVRYSEIQQATGLSESEILSLIREAEVMSNFQTKFTFAEEGAVMMIGNLLPVKKYLGIA